MNPVLQLMCLFCHFSVPNIAAEHVLTERDVPALISLIHNFSTKWYDIGIGLKFTPSELSLIVSKPLLLAAAPTSYLAELLSQWMQWPTVNHPQNPTLRALCEALRSSHVGLGSLADKVEREMSDSNIGEVLAVVCVSALLSLGTCTVGLR